MAILAGPYVVQPPSKTVTTHIQYVGMYITYHCTMKQSMDGSVEHV